MQDILLDLIDDSPDSEPQALAEGRGLMDGNHRRGPFGGMQTVALMMDDGGLRDGRRRAYRGSDRFPANVRGGRVRRRAVWFSEN
jgi:hypothetical protein